MQGGGGATCSEREGATCSERGGATCSEGEGAHAVKEEGPHAVKERGPHALRGKGIVEMMRLGKPAPPLPASTPVSVKVLLTCEGGLLS